MSFLEYRDLIRPDPLWEEVGIYGGYRWIEFPLDSTLWISRRWEPFLATFVEVYNSRSTKGYSCGLQCMREFLDMLGESGALQDRLPSYKDFSQVFSARQALQLAGQKKYATDLMRINPLENTNELRLQHSLARETNVLVIGYSKVVEEMANDLRIKRIFTDSKLYDVPEQVSVTRCKEEDIMSFTDRSHVYLPASRMSLKGLVKNWANVVNYYDF